MSTAPAIDAPPADPAATTRALIEQQIAMLTRLAEIGMEVAEAAGRRACALADDDGAGEGAADPGLSFARAARAVRLTLALQSRLAEGLTALARAEAIARVGEAGRRRHRIHDRVEAAAEAEGCDAVEIERLSSEVWERLDEAEDDDLLALPIDEVVARICRDLGLSPAFAAPAFWAPDDRPHDTQPADAPSARHPPPPFRPMPRRPEQGAPALRACGLRGADPPTRSGPAPQPDDVGWAARGGAHRTPSPSSG